MVHEAGLPGSVVPDNHECPNPTIAFTAVGSVNHRPSAPPPGAGGWGSLPLIG
jgi:hypothetical protein